MGDIEKNKTDVDILCEIWEQKQHNFEMDIRTLLDQSKLLEMKLSTTVDMPAEPLGTARCQQQQKLDQLMIHLSEELQRRHEKASAIRRLQDWQKSLDKMRFKISVLSESLAKAGLIDALAMKQLCDAQDYTQCNYELLSQALHKCEKLRAQNFSILIDQVCSDIDQWCDLTLQFPSARNYHKDCCTEELLVLLEQQLADVKEFYASNKPIFELFANRTKLRTRMEAIEDKSKSPKRYQNRGGSLLREERERKSIAIKLPQIEQQLTELVRAFEQRTKLPFLVHGEELLSRINSDMVDYRLTKEQRSNARKKPTAQSVFEPISPMPASFASVRKTKAVSYFNSTTSIIGTQWVAKEHLEKQRKFSK